jgi:hypothetical protein
MTIYGKWLTIVDQIVSVNFSVASLCALKMIKISFQKMPTLVLSCKLSFYSFILLWLLYQISLKDNMFVNQ